MEPLLTPFLRSRRIRVVAPLLRGSVLDFGCGGGALAAHVHSDSYLGFDPSPKAIEAARAAFPEHRFAGRMQPGRYDTIAAVAVVEHLTDPVSVLVELAGMLKSGGQIVVTTPHPRFEWVHTVGAHIGLASKEAHDEHQELMDRDALEELGAEAGLMAVRYERFLYGMNQLIVFSHS